MSRSRALTNLAVAERPTSFMLNGVKHTYVEEIVPGVVEVRPVDAAEQRASRIGALLKLKSEAEQEIAKILREHLDEVGEPAWLAWCEAKWGWKETQAYTHLNPELLEKDRARARAKRAAAKSEPSDGPKVEPTPVVIPEPEPDDPPLTEYEPVTPEQQERHRVFSLRSAALCAMWRALHDIGHGKTLVERDPVEFWSTLAPEAQPAVLGLAIEVDKWVRGLRRAASGYAEIEPSVEPAPRSPVRAHVVERGQA